MNRSSNSYENITVYLAISYMRGFSLIYTVVMLAMTRLSLCITWAHTTVNVSLDVYSRQENIHWHV